MRGLYAHVSQPMRDDLTAALQARWDTSLRERAAISPHSPAPLLDSLLATYRDQITDGAVRALPSTGPGLQRKPGREQKISQISPSTRKAPIRRVG